MADSGQCKLRSRAVLRSIEPGEGWPECPRCLQRIKFRAKNRRLQVIANVYGGRPRRWVRVEHFHEACYLEAGEPHGPAVGDGRRHA